MRLASELLKEIGVTFSGKDFEVSSFETLKNAKKNNLAFFNNEKLINDLKNTNAGGVLLKEKFVKLLPKDVIPMISDDPYLDMAKLSKFFQKTPFKNSSCHTIHKDAVVDRSVIVGDKTSIESGSHIMAGVVLGSNVKIGKNVRIFPNVVIYDDCIIGDNCIIQAGAIIGSDGFGYAHTKLGEHVKIYHNGNVVLEEDVEIGANSTIDRAVFGSTIIKKNTKIDNLVQIGHNCELGESCIVVAQAGISGSTTLGKNVIMGGQSATSGHLKIGDFTTIAARGGVSKSIEGGKTYGGFPLMLQKDWLKIQIKMIKYFGKRGRNLK